MEDAKCSKTTSHEAAARIKFLELAYMTSVPMSLYAAVRLKVPDAIWAGGSNSPLSPSQILSRISPSHSHSHSHSGGDPDNLERILRMLTSHGVFEEHADGDDQRSYSLADVGKALVTGADGLSYGEFVLFRCQEEMMRAWPLIHEAVLDSTVTPFERVHGEPAYSVCSRKAGMSEMLQRSMSGMSVPVMKALLDKSSGYQGFSGVKRLVDVGGSTGDCLRMIMAKHPNVTEGINFDLPHVVAKAPEIPGVTHVGGDMFKSVPSGDAIFIKWVLTAFTDDECKSVMESCFKALPVGGKLIVCEPVLPKHADDSLRARALLEADVFIMLNFRAQGKPQTEEFFRQLGQSAGFSGFRALYFDCYFAVLEFLK